MLTASSPWIIAWMALATASISYTLTKTPMFNWLRNRLPDRELLVELWQCPYCMAHWVAAALTAAVNPRPFTGGWIDLVLVAFATVTLATYAFQIVVYMSDKFKLMRVEQMLKAQQTAEIMMRGVPPVKGE